MSCASFKSVHQRSGSKHPKAEIFLSWWFVSYAFASFIHSSMDPVFLGRLPSDSLKSPNLPLGRLGTPGFPPTHGSQPWLLQLPSQSSHCHPWDCNGGRLTMEILGFQAIIQKNLSTWKSKMIWAFHLKSLKWLNPEIPVFSPENSINGESLQVIWNPT